MEFFGKIRWGFFDCLTGAFVKIERLPFEIGSGEGCQLKFNDGALPKHCALVDLKDKGLCLFKSEPAAQIVLNGEVTEYAELKVEQDYTLQVGTHLLALRGSKKLDAWRNPLNHQHWFIFDPDTRTTDGPKSLDEICQLARQTQYSLQTIASVSGLDMGFYLQQVLSTHSPAATQVAVPPPLLAEAGRPPNPPGDISINAEHGSLTCPVCWLKFDAGDIMHIAVHDSLRGDPVLGEDVHQRFHATRFNDRRQALDAFGLPSTEIACPHCRRSLPFGFSEVPHYIFSIVGDQSAGKSYFLSVLVKVCNS